MSEQPYHIPALLPQCLDALDIKPDGIYVDATYGGGGHSRAIMERLDAGQGGHLYSFDQDIDAVKRAGEDPRFTMVYSNFRLSPTSCAITMWMVWMVCWLTLGCHSITLTLPTEGFHSVRTVLSTCA